jgi:hypothetical protein
MSMYKSVYRGKSKHKRNILRARKYEANMEPHGSQYGSEYLNSVYIVVTYIVPYGSHMGVNMWPIIQFVTDNSKT